MRKVSRHLRQATLLLASLVSPHSYAACLWSEPSTIPNEHTLLFQECPEEGKIRVNDIELSPDIEFLIRHEHWPEGNSIWGKISPDGKTAVVYIENSRYQRNAWVINLESNQVELFINHSEGKHFIVRFIDDRHFMITHAGMGYRTDYHYERVDGVWRNTSREDIAVSLE